MLLKITEKCSLGCIHCIHDAKPNGRHMSKETLNDVMEFIKNTKCATHIVVSGGEPTEHPEFPEMMSIIVEKCKEITGVSDIDITITTNGFWVLSHQDIAKDIVKLGNDIVHVRWQVSTDERYYPVKLDTSKRIFKEPGFDLYENCVLSMFPMGRAKMNDLHFNDRKSSSCYNIRAISRQINPVRLMDIFYTLEGVNKFCTPSIKINGDISVAESDLCPSCASIYDTEADIIKKIQEYRCEKCGLNYKLPQRYKDVLGI